MRLLPDPHVRVRGQKRPAALLITLAMVGTGTPGLAQFTVCNRTLEIVNVAVGHAVGDEANRNMESSGWWAIGPNQCADIIHEPLAWRYIYVFAEDVFGRPLLPGTAEFCVDTERFEILGERSCLTRGYLEALFQEVDTFRSERWTLFINSSADTAAPGEGQD